MTAWHRGRLLPFDLETTGPDPDYARIVTATLIDIAPDREKVVHEWLVNPGVEIPAGATAVHGITTERAVEDGEAPAVAVADITTRIATALRGGVPLVGHNVSYDLTVLDRECRRHELPTLTDLLGDVAPVVDTFVLDKAVDRFRKGKRTLTATAEHYGVELGEDAHDSSADALAAARIAWRIAEKFAHARVLGPTDVPFRDRDVDDAYRVDFPTSLSTLHDLQVLWRQYQCAGLEAHFRKTNPDAVVNGEWPVQSLPLDWDPQAHPVDERAVA